MTSERDGHRRRSSWRDLLLLEAPDPDTSSDLGTGDQVTAALVTTDRHTQTMGWAMNPSTWFFALRPTDHPWESKAELETLHTFLARGLPEGTTSAEIIGNFPESVDGS